MPSNAWTHKKPTNRRPQVCEPPPPPLPKEAQGKWLNITWYPDTMMGGVDVALALKTDIEWIASVRTFKVDLTGTELIYSEFPDTLLTSVFWNPMTVAQWNAIYVRVTVLWLDGFTIDYTEHAPEL